MEGAVELGLAEVVLVVVVGVEAVGFDAGAEVGAACMRFLPLD